MLSAFRDLIIFGAYRTWVPVWEAKYNLDPMHASGGLFALLVFYLAVTGIPILFGSVVLSCLIYWVLFYWLRNIFYHVLLRKPEFMEWIYLLPFGGLF